MSGPPRVSDVRWYAEHLAEDYLSTNPDGSLVDRAGFLARIARPYPGSNLEALDVRIRVLGDVALIHAGFRDTQPRRQGGRGPLYRHLGPARWPLALRRRSLHSLVTPPGRGRAPRVARSAIVRAMFGAASAALARLGGGPRAGPSRALPRALAALRRPAASPPGPAGDAVLREDLSPGRDRLPGG